MVVLRKSMDRVRTLANLVRRREQEKIRRYVLQAKFLERLFNPLYPYLIEALNTLQRF